MHPFPRFGHNGRVTSPTGVPVTLRLEADRLPGRSCAPAPGFPGYDDIHVGVQRRARPGELLGLTPGDAPAADWTLECLARPAADGTTDLSGPYVQGRPGERFVYLSPGARSPRREL